MSSQTYDHTFTLDDGREILVEYTITPYTPASWDGPAEGGEVEIVEATDENGAPYTPSREEDDRWCLWLSENHDFNADDDGPDPDFEYDRRQDGIDD